MRVALPCHGLPPSTRVHTCLVIKGTPWKSYNSSSWGKQSKMWLQSDCIVGFGIAVKALAMSSEVLVKQ
eukprot:6492562-Amphidinium_carterae.4